MNADVELRRSGIPADLSALSRDELVELGRYVASGSRWALGDLAGQVETDYGEGDLEAYAEEIGVEYATLRAYKAVAKAYPAESVMRITHPWSVYQVFASLKQKDRFGLVTREQPWTYREARELVAERRKPRQVTPKPPVVPAAPKVKAEPPASETVPEKPAANPPKPPEAEQQTGQRVPDAVKPPDAEPDPGPPPCPGCRSLEAKLKAAEEQIARLRAARPDAVLTAEKEFLEDQNAALAARVRELEAKLSASPGGRERPAPAAVPQTVPEVADGPPCAGCGAAGALLAWAVRPDDGAKRSNDLCDSCLAGFAAEHPDWACSRAEPPDPPPVTTQGELDEIYASFTYDDEAITRSP